MSTEQSQSTYAKYAEMGPIDFEEANRRTWSVLEGIRKVVVKHVQDGDINPLEAQRTLALTAAGILGYEEFVSPSTRQFNLMP